MNLSFYHRLTLALVFIFMLVLSGFFYASTHLQTLSKSEAEQRLHLGLAEHLAGDSPLLKEGVYDYEALKNLFHTLMVLGPNFEFYYLDPQGKILTYSADPGKVKRTAVQLDPIRNLIEGQQNLPIFGDDPRQFGQQKIFSASPVYNGDELQGYLYVIIGGEIYDSILEGLSSSNNLQQFALFTATGLLVLLLASALLFRVLTRPLSRLSEDMDKISDEHFRNPEHLQLAEWRSDSGNEIHHLGSTFNAMLKHINEQFEALQHIDSQRRVLLADLSHDLRTPLANLQGYIETLVLKGETLSEADRKRFAEISLRNANNLNKLIDQIFELAYLEGGQVTLNREAFPLGELLHDVLAKFALKADQKHIQLNLSPSQFDYHVFADIGKLERVLTNLLENAIRHTPADGQINLLVSAGQDKLRVDIRDTGVGISEKEVAFIFDARYQATNTEQDSSLHAGLGLAICKKLMALLDSDLTVQSEVGKGTCFSFELPVMAQ